MRFQAAINGLKQALNTLSMSFTSEDFIDQPMGITLGSKLKNWARANRKIFQVPLLTSKINFTVLILKIIEEYLTYRSKSM